MKKRVSRILSIGIALTAVVAVHAQVKALTATVPFSFYAGSNLMPQGDYRVDEAANGTVAWILSANREAVQAVTTFSVIGKKMTEPARLVFHCYGGEYFLAQIWTGGSVGRAVSRSPRETVIAQNGAAPTLAVIQVALHR
jgi:hypothetical protein